MSSFGCRGRLGGRKPVRSRMPAKSTFACIAHGVGTISPKSTQEQTTDLRKIWLAPAQPMCDMQAGLCSLLTQPSHPCGTSNPIPRTLTLIMARGRVPFKLLCTARASMHGEMACCFITE